TSSVPLTCKPSENNSTPRSEGSLSWRAIDSPAAKDSACELTEAEAVATRVPCSNSATATERELSASVVPKISPAVQQPITLERGNGSPRPRRGSPLPYTPGSPPPTTSDL